MAQKIPFPLIAEILTIGTELTTGRVVNTNAAFLSQELSAMGFLVRFHTSVRDEEKDICQAFRMALSRAGLIFITGGLGSTDDDLTTSVITSFVGRPLIRSKEALTDLQVLFNARKRVLTVGALKMITIPKGAQTIKNSAGMACGYNFSYKRSQVIVTPGVPVELKTMLEQEIGPYLQRKFRLEKKDRVWNYVCRRIRTFGTPEAQVGQIVNRSGIREKFPQIQIGYQVPFPEVHVILEIYERIPEAHLTDQLNRAEILLRQVLGDIIFGTNDETLSQVVHKQLDESSQSLAIAESCTGGLVSASLTENSGSSKYFLGSIICYANESKIRDLNVSRDLIQTYGAVSAECAQAMAKGVRERFTANIGLAITGIAGPTGDTPNKPIGTVFVGLDYGGGIISKSFHFPGTRDRVRILSLYAALNHLRLQTQLHFSSHD